jgi:hypothetical protein
MPPHGIPEWVYSGDVWLHVVTDTDTDLSVLYQSGPDRRKEPVVVTTPKTSFERILEDT